MSSKQDVLIIGGGIIGTACAAELAQRGVGVTLIDKGEVGHGCSYGNAGWITPCFAAPLPMPGMLLKSIKWLMDPESPLYIKPRASWELLAWLARFTRAMNQRQMRESVAALTALARYSLDYYAALDAEKPGSFGFERKGLLMVTRTREGLEAAKLEGELVGAHGIASRVLDADGVRQLEPAVTSSALTGGVYFPDEAHAEPLAAVRALAARAVAHGARVLPGTEAFGFERSGRRIDGVQTTRGLLRADQVILAAGSWSPAMAKMLGLRAPILGGKGYAVIVEPFEPAPKIPLMLLENKTAVTPRRGSVRIAGTLELVDGDDSITRRRVDAMVRAARECVRLPAEPGVVEVWRGLRPCTPDGVPILGRAATLDNLIVAAGHQMLGLLTAPGSACLVADLACGTAPRFDPRPFRAERF